MKISPQTFIDASLQEEESIPDRLHMIFSFSSSKPVENGAGVIHGLQFVGPGEADDQAGLSSFVFSFPNAYMISFSVLPDFPITDRLGNLFTCHNPLTSTFILELERGGVHTHAAQNLRSSSLLRIEYCKYLPI